MARVQSINSLPEGDYEIYQPNVASNQTFNTLPPGDYETISEKPRSSFDEGFRTALQAPLGYVAGRFTYPLDIASATMQGATRGAFDEGEAMEEARRLSPNEFHAAPTEEQKRHYTEQVKQNFPTQANVERFIEEKTGIPLSAQTKEQKLLRLAGGAAGFKPGSVAEKGTAAVIAPTVSTFLQDKGMNPELADFIGILTSGANLKKGDVPREPISANIEPPGGPKEPPGATKAPPINEQLQPILKASENFPSEHELGVQVQKALTPESAKVPLPSAPVKAGIPITKPVKISDKSLGIKLISPEIKSVSNEIGKIISPGKFNNTTQGGKAAAQKIRMKDKRIYKNVNKLYKEAESETSKIKDIHPELADKISSDLKKMNEVKEKLRSGPEKEKATAMNELLDMIAVRERDGSISGYRPIKTSTLIEIAQSLGHKVDYDFAHGQPMNIFRTLIGDIKNSAYKSAEAFPSAAAKIRKANEAYADWAQKFSNDYIKPFRDRSNKDFSKLYKGAQDVDEFNMLRNVLEDSKGGKAISNAILRDFVEQKLAPHIASGNAKNFEKQLSELEAVLNPQQARQIRDRFYEKSSLTRKDIKKEVKSILSSGKIPEDISRKADTISGLKNLEQELSKVPGGKELFNKVKEFKAADLIMKGKLRPTDTAKNLSDLLKDRESFSYLVETLGHSRVNQLKALSETLSKSGYIAKVGQNMISLIKLISGSKSQAVHSLLKKILTEENIDRLVH